MSDFDDKGGAAGAAGAAPGPQGGAGAAGAAGAPGAAADPAASCDNVCSSCAESCSSRTEPMDFRAHTNAQTHIKRAIAVVSGKGGVGKSLVTSVIAATLHRQGYAVGILDADVTGPSIPKAFGVSGRLRGNEFGILPAMSKGGIGLISTNLALDEETMPVIWRAPMITGIVKQFYTEVNWGNLDYLLIDMPPGTGDVPLTVYQSLNIDGVVVVTAPQDLVSMIVGKSINMAATMEIPVLGIVENMSYFECPTCAERHELFGPSVVNAIADEYGINLTAKLPISPEYTRLMDAGRAEELQIPALDEFVSKLAEG